MKLITYYTVLKIIKSFLIITLQYFQLHKRTMYTLLKGAAQTVKICVSLETGTYIHQNYWHLAIALGNDDV